MSSPPHKLLIYDSFRVYIAVRWRLTHKLSLDLLLVCILKWFEFVSGKNGVYSDLVNNVKEAFEACDLVRINCEGMNGSDYRKIGAKLKVCDCYSYTFCDFLASASICMLLPNLNRVFKILSYFTPYLFDAFFTNRWSSWIKCLCRLSYVWIKLSL